jgi:hypothetical protein
MDDIQKKIEILQKNYYNENNKSKFFKNNQKKDLAKTITQNISIIDLMKKSVYTIPETNVVFIDYPILKTFLCEDIYDYSINYLLQEYQNNINKYGNYEVSVNLNGFTVSAAQRYQKGIILFTHKCNQSTTKFSEIMDKMTIINPPSMFESIQTILKPFMDPIIFNKIIIKSNK